MSKVLIIDDESDICFLISEILTDESFVCETANNSTDALNKYNKLNPDLIILDVWLGNSELDGIELLLKFKNLNSLVPIVIISGHGTVDMAVNAIKNGAYDIDYVCDYNAFKRGGFEKFDHDILEGSKIALQNKRIVKWIIETGALSRDEIREIARRISEIIQVNFPQNSSKVFIKTSTGYYGGYGATAKDIKTIKSVAGNLQIKASGGVSNLKDSLRMIKAGATRIGTSKALFIYNEK